MSHIELHRLFLLLAVAHFLSDAAFAGGAVLCVGSDEHRAIESEHLANLGCRPESRAEGGQLEAGASPAAPLTGDCADRPLRSDAELVSSQQHGANSQPVVSVDPTRIEPPVGPASGSRRPVCEPDETAAHRAVRTTILIL